jgi:hypothetical protein
MRTGSGGRAAVPGAVRAAVVAAIALASAGPGRPARADVLTNLEPLAGAGATDNATVTANGQLRTASSFSQIGGTLRVHYLGARSESALGYRLMYTRYLAIENPPDSLSHNVAWISTAQLSGRVDLSGGANATLTRSSGVDPSDPAAVIPQAGMAGSLLYLAGQAHQALVYRPNARDTLEETVGVTYLRYLEATMNGMSHVLPTTLGTTLGLAGSRMGGRETYLVEVDGTDMYTHIDTTLPVDPTSYGHTFLVRALAGWRHDLSANWSTLLQAGPSMMARLDGNGVIAPAVIASLLYARVPWSAGLTATQTPVANPYLGTATISDQVLAHVAVPLNRSELIYLGGYGGYIYARVANGTTQLDRAYDQFNAGLTLTARLSKMPFAAAATYSIISQRGNNLPSGFVPDYGRQYVLLTIRGDLTWGPGTPPLFGTPL